MASPEARSHRTVARLLWEAIAEADIAALEKLLDPKTVWRMYGQNPAAGTHRGIDAVLEFMAKIGEMADDLESTLLDIYPNERGAVLHYSVHAQRGPKRLEIEHLFLIRIEDGRVLEGVFAPFDQERYDRFWRDDPGL